MGPTRLGSLFAPDSIAVIGASDSENSVGGRVFANLAADGFSGRIVPINPKYDSVGGTPCFASIGAVEPLVDLAVVATPANTVAGILRDCAEAGVMDVIVLSAGFGETGEEGRAREAELAEVARSTGLRFLGPNCVGLVRPSIGMNATFLRARTPKGHLALISQSGALCSAIADWAEPHHLGFSALVSLGNSVEIDFGDVLSFLATDAETHAILLYVEGIHNARPFISALRLAARTKPVIVLKAGRHHLSGEAAHTHTGALIGSDDVFDAAIERAGAVRTETFGQLFAAAEILSAGTRARGNRLGIITNGGGAGVLAADRAGDLGLTLAEPSEETKEALDRILPAYWSRRNPLDILGDARPGTYEAAVRACLKDRAFDGVLVMLTPQAMTEATDAAEAVITAAAESPRRPILASWMGETSVGEARRRLSAQGIPDFTTPERAVEAFSYLARHELNCRMALEVPGPLSELEPPDLTGARLIVETALAEGRAMLSDVESKALLHAFGIAVNATLEADSAARALVAAEMLGLPVALKIDSPDISHKSDIGGVRTGVMTAADVKIAYREIVEAVRAARPDAEIRGVTVEAMARAEDARELVIGMSSDPVFGPSILFGAGGTMVEILGDSAVSLPPLNAVLANRLINRTRVSNLLEAFRDRPAVDRDEIIQVLLRVSDMICELPEIRELDINPLFAGEGGAIAVDARIRIARPPARQGRYDHMAICPYPRHLVTETVLADGTRLTIRPIRPEDAESEARFVRELSPEARKYRFMHAIRELSPAMLAQFTQIDYSHEMALLALVGPKGQAEQIGVARYVINPDGESCEFAIVVSDQRQHQGIGTRLMKALLDAARDHELKKMEGAVLSENRSMLALMEDLGFTRHPVPGEPDVTHVERWL